MRIHQFEARQVVPIPLHAAWAFFSDPRNLPRITPPWLGFEVTSPLPAEMYAGLIITYRVRPLFGVALAWVTEITHLREPHFFVDEQRFGPYRFWHHQHHFREAEGGTEIHDLVHYALPVAPLAPAVNRWMVSPRVAEIFRFRRAVLAERFPGRG